MCIYVYVVVSVSGVLFVLKKTRIKARCLYIGSFAAGAHGGCCRRSLYTGSFAAGARRGRCRRMSKKCSDLTWSRWERTLGLTWDRLEENLPLTALIQTLARAAATSRNDLLQKFAAISKLAQWTEVCSIFSRSWDYARSGFLCCDIYVTNLHVFYQVRPIILGKTLIQKYQYDIRGVQWCPCNGADGTRNLRLDKQMWKPLAYSVLDNFL